MGISTAEFISAEPSHLLKREVTTFPKDHRPGNIIVGNTGLVILTGTQRSRPEEWEWHYVPDRRCTPPTDDQTRKRNRDLFGYALKSLIDWKKAFNQWEEFGLVEQQTMTSVTFPWMDRFLHKTLDQGSYRSVALDTTAFSGTIDLAAVELTPEVMTRLAGMSARTQLLNPRMHYPPPGRITLA